MKKRVGLIYGGASGEHEVSMISAKNILENIDFEKFAVKTYYINKSNQWFYQGLVEQPGSQLGNDERHSFDPFHLKNEVDVIFPITHGPFGEDGHYQAIFELLNIPYVGCDVLSSAISMDKAVMKDIFSANHIPQGKYLYFTEHMFKTTEQDIIDKIESELNYPCFIKPANLGSSVGISKAKNKEELITSLGIAFNYDEKVVVEEFIKARELEIGVLGNNDYVLSAVGEITTSAEFYDYDAKYISTANNAMIIPAAIPVEIDAQIREAAHLVVRALGVKGISRVDFFYDDKNNRLLVNEINTLPGFTKNSMYPSLFGAVGISYNELITKLIEYAIENQKSKKRHTQKKFTV